MIQSLEFCWSTAQKKAKLLFWDEEFKKTPLKEYLQGRGIKMCHHPTRCQNKIEIVYRKNGTIEVILALLTDEPM